MWNIVMYTSTVQPSLDTELTPVRRVTLKTVTPETLMLAFEQLARTSTNVVITGDRTDETAAEPTEVEQLLAELRRDAFEDEEVTVPFATAI